MESDPSSLDDFENNKTDEGRRTVIRTNKYVQQETFKFQDVLD